jgi:polar amino acid transport system substrate-binding protein
MPLRWVLTLILCMPIWVCRPSVAVAENLVIYAANNFQPAIYLDQDKPAGFLPALFARLEQATGDRYQLVLLPWRRALLYAERGQGGITNFSRNAARERLFDFSQPIYHADIYLLSRKNLFLLNNPNSLQGLKGGGGASASYGQEIDQAIAAGKIMVERDNGAQSRVLKVLYGRIDFALLSGGLSEFKQLIASDPVLTARQSELRLLPEPLVKNPLHLAFLKSMHMQPAIERFDKAFLAFKQTAEYQHLLEAQW